MTLGMSTDSFTLLHVILSLVGIAAGMVVLFGMLASKRLEGWTALFLSTTVLTSVTGFLFHSEKFGPPHVVGVISLLVLAVTIPALYAYRLAGPWRWTYVVGAVLSLYLNVFVGVVQAFQKIPFFNAFAPTQTEPAFAIAQGIVLLIFIALGALAVRWFHPPVKSSALSMA